MSTLRVLLVEDNEGDALLVTRYLEDEAPAAFELVTAERLEDAIDQLATKPFDLALLDLFLPDSDGIDTLKQLLKQSEGIPVVVLTGYDDVLIGSAAVAAGASDYLVKSDINPRTLSRVIKYAIERHQAGRSLANTRIGYERFCDRVRQEAEAILNRIDKLLDPEIDGDARARLLEEVRSASSHLVAAADTIAA